MEQYAKVAYYKACEWYFDKFQYKIVWAFEYF